MRGKLDPQRDQHDAHGLIPAHAGKTPSFMASAKGWRAHPRSHGENVENGCPIFHDPGSSPLTRGKQRLQELRLERLWLIPAHAGKTPSAVPKSWAIWAHPRSCGENRTDDCHKITKRGSSPLTRENAWAEHPNTSRVGSSPLTRGKRKSVGSRRYQEGLIPTHEGKTEQRSPPRLIQRAHPRSREENRAEKAHPAFQKGSSPLTRGKRYRDVRGWLQGRLIPAHVGKTMTAPPVAIHRRAHPRSRGENTGWLSEGGHHYGSSPLTRGKLGVDALNTLDERRIPAHAGKP